MGINAVGSTQKRTREGAMKNNQLQHGQFRACPITNKNCRIVAIEALCPPLEGDVTYIMNDFFESGEASDVVAYLVRQISVALSATPIHIKVYINCPPAVVNRKPVYRCLRNALQRLSKSNLARLRFELTEQGRVTRNGLCRLLILSEYVQFVLDDFDEGTYINSLYVTWIVKRVLIRVVKVNWSRLQFLDLRSVPKVKAVIVERAPAEVRPTLSGIMDDICPGKVFHQQWGPQLLGPGIMTGGLIA